jgi:translation initiation factor IF-2
MKENTAKKQLNNARPPVVVVLGHVDHGKTSLLDTIRKTKVVDKESGGITQHIGAYQIDMPSPITFIDTPGHEAFTAIRSRGASVADVAVLVVAADEGIKPQTKEAIRIINESNTPFIVAINKIDKAGANSQKIKQDLANENVLVEDWGGKVPVVEISAKQNTNIDGLLEMILLVAELEDLKKDLSLPSEGVIIESHLDKRKGYVATALVHKGVLKLGDYIVVGTGVGKIKSMDNFLGESVGEAVPSQPVQIVGWSFAPGIGKKFMSAESKEEAEKIANQNTDTAPLFQVVDKAKSETSVNKALNLILKSDVTSSLEAIEMSLNAIKSDEVSYRVIQYGIGNIGEADVKMAVGVGARILGFRVQADESAKMMAEKEGVKILAFDVIYELIEYVRKEMSDLLDPEIRKNPLGKLKVLAVFKIESKSQIIGGKVTSGKIIKGALADVLRNKNKLLSGRISQLQHNKKDVSEVKEGLECGMKFEILPGQTAWDIKEGDILEIFEEEKIIRSL